MIKREPMASIDLFELPGIAALKRLWDSPFANHRVRQEIRVLLFAELAEAVRQQVPLHEALLLAGRTEGQVRGDWEKKVPFGGLLILAGCTALCAIGPVIGIVFTFYPLLAGRFCNTDMLLRYYGRIMAPLVESGLPLSQAMMRVPHGFSRQEIEIVTEAERTGRLHEALKTLAQYGRNEHRIMFYSSYGIYPLIICSGLFLVMGFHLMKIMPRLLGIYEQLGMQDQLVTAQWNAAIASGKVAMGLLPFAVVLVLFIIVRHIMNGSTFSKLYLLFTFITIAAGAGLALAESIADMSAGTLEMFIYLTVPLASIVTLVVCMPILIFVLERVVLGIEHMSAPLLYFIPFLASMKRSQREAMFITAFQAAASSGVPEVEAIAGAGVIVRGRMGTRAEQAAEFVRQGYSAAQALGKARVLKVETVRQLAVAESSGNYLSRLRAIADDLRFNAEHRIERGGRVMEVAQLIVLSFMVLLFTLSIYVPLSQIALLANKP